MTENDKLNLITQRWGKLSVKASKMSGFFFISFYRNYKFEIQALRKKIGGNKKHFKSVNHRWWCSWWIPKSEEKQKKKSKLRHFAGQIEAPTNSIVCQLFTRRTKKPIWDLLKSSLKYHFERVDRRCSDKSTSRQLRDQKKSHRKFWLPHIKLRNGDFVSFSASRVDQFSSWLHRQNDQEVIATCLSDSSLQCDCILLCT